MGAAVPTLLGAYPIFHAKGYFYLPRIKDGGAAVVRRKGGRFGSRAAVAQERWLARWSLWKRGDRWWPFFSRIYMLTASNDFAECG